MLTPHYIRTNNKFNCAVSGSQQLYSNYLKCYYYLENVFLSCYHTVFSEFSLEVDVPRAVIIR